MRGKVLPSLLRFIGDGITPAHAGKSEAAAAFLQDALDHPRTCGEKQTLLYTDVQKFGSPPHMRGKDLYSPGTL